MALGIADRQRGRRGARRHRRRHATPCSPWSTPGMNVPRLGAAPNVSASTPGTVPPTSTGTSVPPDGRRHAARRRREHARRDLDARPDVGQDAGLGERGLRVAEARVPRAPAVVALAPRDRVVVVDAVGPVVLRVRRLVHLEQDVHARRAARRCSRRRSRCSAPCSCTTRQPGSSGPEDRPWTGPSCPRRRPWRSAFRPGGCGSTRPPGCRTSASRTRRRRPRGCPRSPCRS